MKKRRGDALALVAGASPLPLALTCRRAAASPVHPAFRWTSNHGSVTGKISISLHATQEGLLTVSTLRN